MGVRVVNVVGSELDEELDQNGFRHRARTARVLVLTTTALPANACYPDTGTWLIRNGPDEELLVRPDAPAPTR